MWVAIVVIVAVVVVIVGGVAYMVWERRGWRFDASGEVHSQGDDAEAEAPVEPRVHEREEAGGEPGVSDSPSK
jgi:flagellar basal body-associated protein FliL